MKTIGAGKSGILVLIDMPHDSAENIVLFTNNTGRQYVNLIERLFKVKFYTDCIVASVSPILPANGKFPKRTAIKDHLVELHDFILALKPVIILAIGKEAARFTLPDIPSKLSEDVLHGRLFKSFAYNCVVGCLLSDLNIPDNVRFAATDLLKIRQAFLDENTFLSLDEDSFEIITAADDVCDILTTIIKDDKLTAFDYETVSKNPRSPDARLLTTSISNDPAIGYCIPLDWRNRQFWSEAQYKQVMAKWNEFLASSVKKVIQNAAYEWDWSIDYCKQKINNVVYDTMVGYHVLDGTPNITSLDFQVFEVSGKSYKKMVNIEDLESEPLEKVAKYNTLDARWTLALAQRRFLYMANHKQKFPDALWPTAPTKFMMDALPVSWTMQTNGITVDAVALDKQIAHHTEQAKQLMEKIETSDIAKVFEKKNNQPLKYNSTADLRKLFYKQLKLRPTKLTETGVPSTDAESIEALVTSKDLQADAKDFLQTLLTYRKHEKILSTYLLPYKDYTTAEQTIHATFALHTTRTYRSSYISPNLQNIPKRSEFGAQLRTVFVPKYDWFLDGDFKGAELRVMAMYSQDPALIHAANNNIDIHTYWTARVFDISEDKVTKEQRDKAKQFFVFALFYGGWYKTAARMLDVPVARIKKLEDELWAMYPKMKAWQEQIKQHYNKYGFVENLQGFRRYGPLSIREQINTPIQGTSFLILLDCMKNLHNELTAKNFKSYICLQIHDELVVDCKESEIEEIVDIANKHFNITIYNVQIMVEWSIGKNFGELRKISV